MKSCVQSLQKEGKKEELFLNKKLGSKTYFDCQCGKRYDNFPALYLHFQRKHGKKISTKLHNESYKVYEDEKLKVLTYLFSEKVTLSGSAHRNSNLSDPQNSFSFLLEEFSLNNPPHQYGFEQNKYTEYKGVVNELLKEVFHDPSRALTNEVKNIPLFLNQIYFRGVGKKINSQEGQSFCSFLLLFACWLKRREYTDYIVEYVGLHSMVSEVSLQ